MGMLLTWWSAVRPAGAKVKNKALGTAPWGTASTEGVGAWPREEQALIECLLGARRFKGISSLSLGRKGSPSRFPGGKLRPGRDATH